MNNVLLFSDKQRTIVYLTIIGIIGLAIRLYFYPFDLPVIQDALETYFLYAIEIRQLGYLPTNWTPFNNLWPAFLGMVFQMFSFENNMMFFMQLQRSISILFSILTLIPVYFLCKKFNDSRFALLGAAFFILDPRIIHNSLFGITEALYFLLGISSIVLILNEKRKFVYLSFVFVAVATLVRAEGIFILVAISMLYFVQYRKNRKKLLEYGILLGIFVLIILPMSVYRLDVTGSDGIFFRAVDALSTDETDENQTEFTISFTSKISNSIETTLKYLGWIMIPNFILFVPIGFLLLLKKRDFQTFFIIVTSIIVSIPAIGAYSVGVLETRYLYILFPMFSLMALITIQKICQNKQISKYIILTIVVGLIVGSVFYLNLKVLDYEHEREAYDIAKQISKNVQVVNQYSKAEYLLAASIDEQWPYIANNFNKIEIVSAEKFESMEELIKNSHPSKLTDIIVDNSQEQPNYLQKLMLDEETYPYLLKEFDSMELGYNYHVKVFDIDYDQFNSLQGVN